MKEMIFIITYLYAALIALPSGLFCGAAELIGVRHRPPLWIGWAAVGLSLPGLAIVFFNIEEVLLFMLNILPKSIGELGFLLLGIIVLGLVFGLVYLLPVLISLALVTLLPAARWRLIAIWSIVIGISSWALFQAQQKEIPGLQSAGFILAGLGVSMLIWQVAFVLGQRRLRKIAIPSAPGPELDRLMEKES
jgi:hypothetical protein